MPKKSVEPTGGESGMPDFEIKKNSDRSLKRVEKKGKKTKPVEDEPVEVDVVENSSVEASEELKNEIRAVWGPVSEHLDDLDPAGVDLVVSTGIDWGWFDKSEPTTQFGDMIKRCDELFGKIDSGLSEVEASELLDVAKQLKGCLDYVDKIKQPLSAVNPKIIVEPTPVSAPAPAPEPKPVAATIDVTPASTPDVNPVSTPDVVPAKDVEPVEELTREKIVGAVEYGLDIVKKELRHAKGEMHDRMQWVLDAVNPALVEAGRDPNGKIKVGTDGHVQYEGVPVDDLIEVLDEIAKTNTKDKTKIEDVIKLLSDNSESYFDAHPAMKGKLGENWDQQHWRTQLEAYYISKDVRATGNTDEDYKKAMDVMNKRRELDLSKFVAAKKDTKPDKAYSLADVKGISAPQSVDVVGVAPVVGKAATVVETLVDSEWSSSYHKAQNEKVPDTGPLSKMTERELAQWRQYNDWVMCLAAASEGGLAQLADANIEDQKVFNDMVRGLVESFAVHGKIYENPKTGDVLKLDYADLDGRACIKLFTLAGFNADLKEGRPKLKDGKEDRGNVGFAKPGKSIPDVFNTDTGGREGFDFRVSLPEGEPNKWANLAFNTIRGVTTVLDHHAWFSDSKSSAAGKLYKWLTDYGYLKRTKELDRVLDFITDIDSASYYGYAFDKRGDKTIQAENKKTFEESPRTLIGMVQFVPYEKFDELFKLVSDEKFDATQQLTKEQMASLGIIPPDTNFDAIDTVVEKIVSEHGQFPSGLPKEISDNNYFKEKLKVMETPLEFEKLERDGLAISVLQKRDGKPIKVAIGFRGTGDILSTGFKGAVAQGADIFVDWNEDKQSFFVSSAFTLPTGINRVAGLENIDGVRLIRGTMLIKPLTEKGRTVVPVKIKLKDLLNELVGTDWQPTGVLKDFIEKQKSTK